MISAFAGRQVLFGFFTKNFSIKSIVYCFVLMKKRTNFFVDWNVEISNRFELIKTI